MVSDAKKIAAFTALLQENLNNWIANHEQSLGALEQQFGDDDEKNAQAIEAWLKEHEDLYEQYRAKLASPKRSLSLIGKKGGFGTKPTGNDNFLAEQIEQAVKGIKPPGNDKSLDEMIKQEVKTNTNLGNSEPSPDTNREKPQS